MAVAVVLMAVLAVGAISLGRLTAVRSDAQQASDSAVLAAAQIIRDRGMPFDGAARASAEDLARRNSRLPASFAWNVSETATAVHVEVETTIPVSLPTLIFSGGSRDVHASASGQVTQSRFDEAERRLPKLALVLDYSGSMDLPFSGGGGRAIDILESSVAGLLAADLMIDYGGVFYSSDVFRTIAVGPGAPAQIVDAMNTYDAGGMTATSLAINAGRNILTAVDNTGYYILLVSDGEPNNGGGFAGAIAAAHNAWNADVTIFTLEIRRSGSSAALDQFMTNVAGTPSSRGDASYHYVATTASDLIDQFENIVASIVCKVGPISPVPSDPATLRVFLSHGGVERLVPATADLAADSAIEAYQYDGAEACIRLTATACDAIIDLGDEIVVRFDRPSLTE
jgi:hypothetical protein